MTRGARGENFDRYGLGLGSWACWGRWVLGLGPAEEAGSWVLGPGPKTRAWGPRSRGEFGLSSADAVGLLLALIIVAAQPCCVLRPSTVSGYMTSMLRDMVLFPYYRVWQKSGYWSTAAASAREDQTGGSAWPKSAANDWSPSARDAQRQIPPSSASPDDSAIVVCVWDQCFNECDPRIAIPPDVDRRVV